MTSSAERMALADRLSRIAPSMGHPANRRDLASAARLLREPVAGEGSAHADRVLGHLDYLASSSDMAVDHVNVGRTATRAARLIRALLNGVRP